MLNVGELGVLLSKTSKHFIKKKLRGHCGRDRMVVGFTTTCVISAYHH